MKNLAFIFGIAALLSSCKQSSFVAEDDVYSTGSSNSKFAGNNSDASYNSYVYSKQNSSTKSAYYNPNSRVDTSGYYNPNSSYANANGGNTYINNNYYGNTNYGSNGYGGYNYYNQNYFHNGWYGFGLMSSSFGYGYGGYGYGYGGYGSGYYPHNYYGYNPYGMYGYGMYPYGGYSYNPYGMYGMSPYGGYGYYPYGGGYGMYGMSPYGGYGYNPYGMYGGYGGYGMSPYGYGGYGGGYGMSPYSGGQMTTYEMTSSGYYKNGNNYIGHHQYSNATPQSYSSYTPKEKMMVVDPINSTPISVPNASNRKTYTKTEVVQGQRGVIIATVAPDSKPWKPAIEATQNGLGTVATRNRAVVNPTQNNSSSATPVNRPNVVSERPVVINRPAVQGSSTPSSNSSMDQWRRSEPSQNTQPNSNYNYRGTQTSSPQPYNRGTQTSSPQPVNRTGTQPSTYSSPRNEGYSSPIPTNNGGSYNRGSGSTYSSPAGGGGYGGGSGGGRPASSSPVGGSTRR